MSPLIQQAEKPSKTRHGAGGLGPLFVLLLLTGTALVPTTRAFAQELQCSVTVNARALTGSDYSHLDRLKQQIEEYLNDRAWTEDTFLPEERIQCTLTLTFTSANTSGIDVFAAKLSVGSVRPIYGAPTPTSIFQYIDENWQFEYDRNQSLFFDPERFNALTSLLDFYAYVILGYDYDTFSELGGTRHFERARRIAEIANAAGASGWNPVADERNRAALISRMLDPRMQDFRKAMYKYNLQGLDLFLTNLTVARQNVLDALTSIKAVNEQIPTNLPVSLFFAAKKQELTAIFDGSNFSSRAYGLLLEVDPQNAGTYDRLVQ